MHQKKKKTLIECKILNFCLKAKILSHFNSKLGQRYLSVRDGRENPFFELSPKRYLYLRQFKKRLELQPGAFPAAAGTRNAQIIKTFIYFVRPKSEI